MSLVKQNENTKIEFFEIKDQAMISKFLTTLGNLKTPVTMWLKDKPVRWETKVKDYLQFTRRLTFDFPSSMTVDEFKAEISKQGSPMVLGSFQLQTVNFFFKSSFVSFLDDNTSLQLEIPKEIFKLQRRAALRISFLRRDAPKISVFDPRKEYSMTTPNSDKDVVAFRMLDVSTGGLSFAAPVDYKDDLIRGKKLYRLKFKLRGKEVVATAKIMHVKETMSDMAQPMLKIGVQFLDLKGDFERWIEYFIIDESRDIFTLIFQ